MTDSLTIHPDHFDDLALDIAGDLLNRGLIADNKPAMSGPRSDNFDNAVEIIVHRLKHQQFVNDHPEDYIDSPSKGPMNEAID